MPRPRHRRPPYTPAARDADPGAAAASRSARATIDTVVLAFTDMQGRLQGKRLAAEFFLDEVAEHCSEGCNYLLAVDVDMNTVDGYAMSSWERGYGDFVHAAGPRHAAPDALASGHGAGARRPDLAGRHAGGRLAAADPAAPGATGWPSAAGPRWPAPSWSSSSTPDTYEQAWQRGYRGPDAGQPVQRRLLDPRHLAGRAAAAPDPQRHGRRRDVRRVGQGRVQPRPARDRLPLRRRGHHLRQPLDLQDRREGDRRAGGHEHHVHGQAQRARGQLLPHPPVAARQRRRRRCWPATARTACPRLGEHFLAGQLAAHARADPAVRAEHQLLQALRAGQLRAHGGALGRGQPDLRAAAGRPRAPRCAWRTARPAATSTPTWPWPR